MSGQGSEATKIWQDREFAEDWVKADGSEGMLGLPRRMAAAIAAHDRPESSLVIDIASGPGAFLAAMLDELPSARGIWTDASEAMADEARRRLTAYGERVELRTVDMTDLATAGLPSGTDVIVTSRAAHHLDRAELHRFYRQAAELLAPGGWLVNLDHIGPADVWDRRLRAVRPRFVPSAGEGPKHHHNYPLTGVADHLDAYREAGIDDVEVVWRGFYTCLFMGRRPGS
ncbi:MAG: class I SAM-dependent methyltransferase [Acidimicrobiales bacterium]